MWKIILLSIFVSFSVSEKVIEKDPDYPLERLNKLDLWKYNFASGRQKRSSADDQRLGDDYLREVKLCDSAISFRRPQKLRNVNDKWRTIVNHANFTQFVRFEKCSSLNFPCTYEVYPQNVRSFCQQSHLKLALWAFDEEANCLIMDKFLIPSACECIIEKEDFFSGVSRNLLRP